VPSSNFVQSSRSGRIARFFNGNWNSMEVTHSTTLCPIVTQSSDSTTKPDLNCLTLNGSCGPCTLPRPMKLKYKFAPIWNEGQMSWLLLCHINHGRATEEGRRTGFPLLRYGCQLRASVLEHSSIWRNLKCLL
jgi:hypothetical protein